MSGTSTILMSFSLIGTANGVSENACPIRAAHLGEVTKSFDDAEIRLEVIILVEERGTKLLEKNRISEGAFEA